MSKKRVYVSSTYVDLAQHRAALKSTLHERGIRFPRLVDLDQKDLACATSSTLAAKVAMNRFPRMSGRFTAGASEDHQGVGTTW
jgi:hypothetical protein